MCTSSTRPCARCARTSPGPAAISGWCRIRRPRPPRRPRPRERRRRTGRQPRTRSARRGLRRTLVAVRAPGREGVAPLGGPRHRERPGRRRPAGVEPLRRYHHDGRTSSCARVLRPLRPRAPALRPDPRPDAHGSDGHAGCARPGWCRRRGATPPTSCAPARSPIVFPGGDHDAYRPTRQSAVVDFAGRTGYVRSALEAGVPIVPVVSIGGQESQLYLARGERSPDASACSSGCARSTGR